MIQIVVMFLLLLLITWSHLIEAAPDEDEITNLPGLSDPLKFRQYSGYLKAGESKFLHYWFTESQGSPSRDPVILWLNGGPGCSSLDGFLYELGPLHVRSDGETLYLNNNTWNLISNLLFLESPAGVGFSYSTTPNVTQYDDDVVARDNHAAVRDFFRKFPEFSARDFYIAGESYGGIYVPTLARLIAAEGEMRLRGFAVGNGMSSFYLNAQSLPYFAYYHALIGRDEFDELLAACCTGPRDLGCNFYNQTSVRCQRVVRLLTQTMYGIGLNEYGLYTDCSESRRRYAQLLRAVAPPGTDYLLLEESNFLHHDRSRKMSRGGGGSLRVDPPCINVTAVSHWLNQVEVRQALHIPTSVRDWQVCSEEVGAHYKVLYKDMTPFYHQLLQSVDGGGLRALVYNGDTDMACNVLMDEWFVESLGYSVSTTWRPWHVYDQVTGFTKLFLSNRLQFTTIKGAGHMVPQWRPGPALKMMSAFISNKPLD